MPYKVNIQSWDDQLVGIQLEQGEKFLVSLAGPPKRELEGGTPEPKDMAHFVDEDALTMDSCSQVKSVEETIGFTFRIALDQCIFKFIDLLDDSAAMTITQG